MPGRPPLGGKESWARCARKADGFIFGENVFRPYWASGFGSAGCCPRGSFQRFPASSLGTRGATAPLLPALLCQWPSPPGHQQDRWCGLRATGPGLLCPAARGQPVSLPGYRAVGASTSLPERSSSHSPGGDGLLRKPGDQTRNTPSGNVPRTPWETELCLGPRALGLSWVIRKVARDPRAQAGDAGPSQGLQRGRCGLPRGLGCCWELVLVPRPS